MKYVLTLATKNYNQFTHDFELIIVEKDKPQWQVGRWNLPGGKVEDDEASYQAAYREFKEERVLLLLIF